jgi:hypothetical protein
MNMIKNFSLILVFLLGLFIFLLPINLEFPFLGIKYFVGLSLLAISCFFILKTNSYSFGEKDQGNRNIRKLRNYIKGALTLIRYN